MNSTHPRDEEKRSIRNIRMVPMSCEPVTCIWMFFVLSVATEHLAARAPGKI